ncbi:MAG: maltotransferase domain-containing protein [Candidatus Binatia bacterium]
MPDRGSRFPRLLIERVSPAIDGGRYPVKRLVGDVVEVAADVIKDGHDLVAARICHRPEGEREWRHAPMAYDYDTDRWSGSFSVDRVGRWVFSIEAWTGVYGTWLDHLGKKLAASQDVAADLLEGSDLVGTAARRATAAARDRLREVAGILRDPGRPAPERSAIALAEDVRRLMAEHFDPKEVVRHEPELGIVVDRESAGFAAWYEMFPRSQAPEPGRHGTFADAERRLPRLAELGFDVVYLPPIHPIGRTHRKGRDNMLECGPGDPGSPWAIGAEEGGFTAVHPELGTLEDFERFVRRARELGMEVALDYALQCSPDHPWVKEHPEWFFIRPDGAIKYAENPPKKYQDIHPLNFWSSDRQALWEACRDVVFFWIERGVRSFRVDNPHTKPLSFWEWMIAEVKQRHPDVVFLSEAFTRPKRMKALAKIGFTQSYTYFTWRNSPWELTEYLTELARTETAEYFRPNFFANTPDILHEYLQTGGRPAFQVRLVLAATLSPLYGIYSGFELCENVPLRPGSEEYLNSEKYEIRVRDWEAPGNLNGDIAALNRIRRENPALRQLRNISFHVSENDRILFFRKWAPGDDVLVAVNLNPHHGEATMVHVPLADMLLAPDQAYVVEDLLTGDRYTWMGVRNYVHLDPAAGQVAHVLRLVRGPA